MIIYDDPELPIEPLKPREFSLPVSDCGCFVAGEIPAMSGPDGKPWPKNGVIIFYENIETMKAAFKAASDAHWPQS